METNRLTPETPFAAARNGEVLKVTGIGRSLAFISYDRLTKTGYAISLPDPQECAEELLKRIQMDEHTRTVAIGSLRGNYSLKKLFENRIPKDYKRHVLDRTEDHYFRCGTRGFDSMGARLESGDGMTRIVLDYRRHIPNYQYGYVEVEVLKL